MSDDKFKAQQERTPKRRHSILKEASMHGGMGPRRERRDKRNRRANEWRSDLDSD